MEIPQAPTWDNETGEWVATDGRRFAVRPDGASGFRVVSHGPDADPARADADAPASEVYALESDAKEAALRLAGAHRPGGNLP